MTTAQATIDQQVRRALLQIFGSALQNGSNGNGVHTTPSTTPDTVLNPILPRQVCPHCGKKGRRHTGEPPLCQIVHVLATMGPAGLTTGQLVEQSTRGRITPTHPAFDAARKRISARVKQIQKRLLAEHALHVQRTSMSQGTRDDGLPNPCHIWQVAKTKPEEAQ